MSNTKTQKQRNKSATPRPANVSATTQSGFKTGKGSSLREGTYEPSHEEISMLAHRNYEEQGYPDRCSDEHWHEAERLLRQRGPHGFEQPHRDPLAIA